MNTGGTFKTEPVAQARRRLEKLMYSLGLADIETNILVLPRNQYVEVRKPPPRLYLPVNCTIHVHLDDVGIEVGPLDMIALPTQRDYRISSHSSNVEQTRGSLQTLESTQAEAALVRPQAVVGSVIIAYISPAVRDELAEFAPQFKLLRHPDGAHFPALPEISELLRRPDIALQDGLAFLRSRLAAIVAVSCILDEFDRLEPSGERSLRGVFDPIIAKATVEVRTRPEHPWTLDALASAAGCSRSTLVSRFRNMLGVSPRNFVMAYRLDLAAQLVSKNDLPLARIAERVGFASESSLSKAFKRYYGRSPSKFRTEDVQQARPLSSPR